MKNPVIFLFCFMIFSSCNNAEKKYDASGVFESDEVIVSSETSGKILKLSAIEGAVVDSGAVVAIIDSVNLVLQKEQIEASVAALQKKTNNPQPYLSVLEEQLAVQRSQLETAEREKLRFERLLKAEATNAKKVDDIIAGIDVLKKQMEVTRKQMDQQRSMLSTQNNGILSESGPLEKRSEQLQDLINRCVVKNPVSGTILAKYAEAGEITSAGKPLYKIANTSTLTLRAYISGNQLSSVKLNQQVEVLTDDGKEGYKSYTGTVSSIAGKAEFTPKTIQTKEERANLVYAIKITVKNDGLLKIGMYGEVILHKQANK